MALARQQELDLLWGDKVMKEGIYENLSNEAYHADPAIGSSGLKAFGECPAIYAYEYLNPDRAKERASKYTSIGSYAHVLLLEPDLFDKTYAVADKSIKNRVVKAWKEFAFNAEAEGKQPMLWKDYERTCQMTATIKHHELASSMLTKGKAEVSFFAKDEATGLMMKSRPDYLVNVPGIGIVLVDYKTTSISMGTTKQSHHAFGLGRHIQAAHHKTVTEIATGGKINEVCYVTQMQEAPYLVRIFRMPEEAIQIGIDQCRIYLDGIADCYAKGDFPGWPQSIEDMIVPNWLSYEFN